MQSIDLDMVPRYCSPVCHISQNDSGRTIRCNLFDNFIPMVLTGNEVVVLRTRNSVGRAVSVSVENTSDKYVDITIPESVTEEKGSVYCKLRIDNIGAHSFYLLVESES